MNSILLTLQGTMRSWGSSSIGDDRWTQQWPSASAILGLAGACMGVNRHNSQQMEAWYNGFDVCTLSAAAYRNISSHLEDTLTQYPQILSDFHTTQNSINMRNRPQEYTVTSNRGYITDGLDVAAIIPRHSEAEHWLTQLIYALQQPNFTPYLGRRSNPLAAPIINPGETITKSKSINELCELLYLRLSHLNVGHLKPTEGVLRVPAKFSHEHERLHDDWNYICDEQTPEQRTGMLKFYTSINIETYKRSMNQEG